MLGRALIKKIVLILVALVLAAMYLCVAIYIFVLIEQMFCPEYVFDACYQASFWKNLVVWIYWAFVGAVAIGFMVMVFIKYFKSSVNTVEDT